MCCIDCYFWHILRWWLMLGIRIPQHIPCTSVIVPCMITITITIITIIIVVVIVVIIIIIIILIVFVVFVCCVWLFVAWATQQRLCIRISRDTHAAAATTAPHYPYKQRNTQKERNQRERKQIHHITKAKGMWDHIHH